MLTHVAYAWEDYMFKNQLEFSTGLTLLCDFTEKIQFASPNGVRSFMKSLEEAKAEILEKNRVFFNDFKTKTGHLKIN